MKILVTGGAGFIGSHLVDALIQKGHRVAVIDNLSTGQKRNLNKKAKFYHLNILDRKVGGIFKNEKFNAVYHLAAQINVRKSVLDPLFDAQVNILGSLNILENCRKYKIKKFIFTSTGGALYGETEVIPTSELYPTQPFSPYGIAKLTVENYLYYYFKEFKLVYSVLRLANVYGLRQDPRGEAGVVSVFLTTLLKKQTPIIFGNGRQSRDYVFVKDVVTALLLALKKKGGVYNVGTGKETSVNGLFKKINHLGKFSAQAKPGPALKGEVIRSCLDCSKIKKEWGFKAEYGLERGLKETIIWFREKGG